jgi:hypothetical protein
MASFAALPGWEDLVQLDPDGLGFGQRRCSRLLPVRPPLPRWRADQCGAITRAKGATSRSAFECRHAIAIQRSSGRTGPRVLCQGLRIVARGNHLQARGCILFARESRPVGEGQVREPRGVRGGRLDRSRGFPTLARGASARILCSGRAARLCRTRRSWNRPCGTRAVDFNLSPRPRCRCR